MFSSGDTAVTTGCLCARNEVVADFATSDSKGAMQVASWLWTNGSTLHSSKVTGGVIRVFHPVCICRMDLLWNTYDGFTLQRVVWGTVGIWGPGAVTTRHLVIVKPE